MGSRKKRGTNNQEFDQYEEESLPFQKTQYLKVRKFKAKTEAQRIAQEIIEDKTLVFLEGPAGVGKTIGACYEALSRLADGSVKRIVITRPNVESGPKLGFLPGNGDEKLLPYLVPLLDNFEIFIPIEKLNELLQYRVIEIVPVGFARGRTFNDAFFIVDEAQNLKRDELKMLLTRIGFGSKCVVTYDPGQIDIKKNESCVIDIRKLGTYTQGGIGFFEYSAEDVVRSEICAEIVDIYKELEGNNG